MEKNRLPQRFILSGTLLLSVLALTAWFASQARPAAADPVPVVLDGVRDAEYVQIAADPAGDLANPGPGEWSGVAWTDLTGLYVAADATHLYVYVDSPGLNVTDSDGQIGMVIDTDAAIGSGGAADAWGNAISFAYSNVDGRDTIGTHLPDYLIRGDIYRPGGPSGWTELRTWSNGNWDTGSGVNWGGINGSYIGSNIAYSPTQGIELAIPLADIGNPDPYDVHLQVFATQGGGTKGAYDTVPSDDQSTGWDDATIQQNVVSVPVAVDPAGDLANPGPAQWNGVAWTDATNLHIWNDYANLYLYIPSAYTTTLSQGQIALAIDTGVPGGGTADAWGNAITFAYTATHQNLGSTPMAVAEALPDYLIRGNIFGPADNGWTEFRTWNGTNWDTGSGVDWGGIGNSGFPSLPNSNIAWSDGEGLRITIPLADIDVEGGDVVNLQFIGTQSGGNKGAYDTVPADDQSTGWDDATTQKFLASYEVKSYPAPTECLASQDNNVWWGDLGHDSRDSLYRNPGGPVTTNTAVTLRFRSACDDLTRVRVRVWNDVPNSSALYNLTKVATAHPYDWWEVTLPASAEPTIYWYRFIAEDGSSIAYYEDDSARLGGWGQAFAESPDNGWQLTIYDPAFQTPDWVKDAVIYQIFPDRFRNGDEANDPTAGRFFYNEAGGAIVRSNGTTWNNVICDPRDLDGTCPNGYSNNFYGGDLQGVIDQLDYLQEIGVNTLYFNPIFASPSNHKYDTADYSQISEDFGDLATFQALAAEADARGMYIILDGVFNHTSSDSFYFDRYQRYDDEGNVTSPGIGINDGSGACESHNNPFRSWFYFTDVTPPGGDCASSTGVANGANYESWFGYDSLPKLRANSPEVRDLIWDTPEGIAKYWMQYADGWRLDVGGDVDPGQANDPNNTYWEGFRAAVLETNPEAYIVLEEWGNASAWLLGEEMDATMNYQYSTAMLGFWRDSALADNDHNTSSSAGVIEPFTPSELDERLHNWMERYPPEALYAMMNLLGSHDTNRSLFLLDHNAALGIDSTPFQNPNYDWSDAQTRLKGVWILQMTLPGAPTTYYGDEVGLVGPVYYHGGRWEDDPYNRQPFPWLDETGTPFYAHLQNQASQDEMKEYFTLLTTTRNQHPALRTGDFTTLLVDDEAEVYAYGRKMADGSDAGIVIVNRSGTIASPITQTVSLDVDGYLPHGTELTDAISGQVYIVSNDGGLSVDVPGESGVILVISEPLPEPPAPVSDLAVVAERSEELDLAWTAVPEADSYDIFRSLVSGGGYEYVDSTSNITYTDTGLENATTYYYVLVSHDDDTQLDSGYSNEAWGTPHHDLDSAWYNLADPAEITHTISTITPTENIYGQLFIDQETGGNGPASGITAQIGYAVQGTLPISGTGWLWVEMSYDTAVGNNDQYVGNLLPSAVGEYWYATRWSSDGGETWYYSDLAGPGFDPADAGLLHVISSGDETAPDTPLNLTLDGTTPSSVMMSWDAVTNSGDLAGYEIYRQHETVAHAPQVFELIDSVDNATTSYVDQTVTTDETYSYCVRAFDTSFNRSACSNIITATAETRMVTVVFHVSVPEHTPGNIYISGNQPQFGPWNPGIAAMTHVTGTIWAYTTTLADGSPVQYKYTRGSWDTVESWGSIIVFANREMTVEYGETGVQIVDNTSTDWGNGEDSTKAVEYWRDPFVIAYEPAAGSLVTLTTNVTVTWSITMITGTDFVVADTAGNVVSGTFANDNQTRTTIFTPDQPLIFGKEYVVTVTGQQTNGVPGGDAGTQQVPTVWRFRAGGYRAMLPIINR